MGVPQFCVYMSVSRSEVESVFENVVQDLLQSNNNHVSNPSEINNGFCSIVAAEVYERLGQPSNMNLCKDVDSEHYWLEVNEMFFDSERTAGVDDWRDLPYWNRHTPPSNSFEYALWVKHTGF